MYNPYQMPQGLGAMSWQDPWVQYNMRQFGAGGGMPPNLQITPNIGHAAGERARESVMASTVRPNAANLSVQMGSAGMGNSTFAAARNAALTAEGSRMAEDAAQDAIDRETDRTIALRNSYYNTEVQGGIQADEREREAREKRMEQLGSYGQAGIGALGMGFRPTYNPQTQQQGPSMFGQMGSAIGQSPLGQFAGGIANGIGSMFRF